MCYPVAMEKQQPTYFQKMAAVLREIGLNKHDKEIEDVDILGLGVCRTQRFQGQLDPSLTFRGAWSQNVAGGQYDHWSEELSVELMYQGQKLCEMLAPGRFVNVPEIVVKTPLHAGETAGSTTELGEKDQRLTVYHAQQADPRTVLDNIFRTVARSRMRMIQAKKLSQLNLAGQNQNRTANRLAPTHEK